MELSEFVQEGLQYLADSGCFNDKAFAVMIEVAFRSLLLSSSDDTVLDNNELKHIEQTVVKHCHSAVATCILECVKQNADRSTICTCLEDIRFDPERIDTFCRLFQKHKKDLENVLSSIGRSLPHISDASWRLEYQIKNSHLHKVNQPSYLITLSTENCGSSSAEEVNFSCTMEQLQDLVGKMKDAAKSLEKATQL
ncbi:COMM domain-containing protein 3 [Brienomyrus brachyistius]|uniref:COMM domain-containing protein 3 n=1 Tax=Brienomyrus brachyistius TaxID=42636 RepID=UPI0020B33D8E|nr:COMM domain-containing protein 3 [Brienomyrus brachyistius]